MSLLIFKALERKLAIFLTKTEKVWCIYFSSRWVQNTIYSRSYILKRLTTMPVAYTGEMSSIKGVWYKPHYRNHVLLSSPYNLFANCRARARDEKERKKERIRGINQKNPLLCWAIRALFAGQRTFCIALLSSCLCSAAHPSKDVPCNFNETSLLF